MCPNAPCGARCVRAVAVELGVDSTIESRRVGGATAIDLIVVALRGRRAVVDHVGRVPSNRRRPARSTRSGWSTDTALGPRTTVVDPELTLHPNAESLPHVYPWDELCLYSPASGDTTCSWRPRCCRGPRSGSCTTSSGSSPD